MNKIKKLSQNLIDLIAAGEVVERPASVIKELIENAIDSGADRIKVVIKNAGLDLIEVSDNGSGMSKDDSILAFTQHATSKIDSEEDLEKISTMGFRGEALASIASVSEESKILTRVDSNSIETSLKKGVLNSTTRDRSERGTTVSILGLFKNIPARLKFLKSLNTENRQNTDMFINTALPFLGINFELEVDGKNIYRLSKTDDLKNRIFELFGKETAKNLEMNNGEINGIQIDGALGNSFIGKKTNKTQYIYLNNRFIKSGLINTAVAKAYQGQLHKDLKPTYFIFLKIDPRKVDVNVHPRKIEVKFENEGEIFSSIFSFTKKTLEKSYKMGTPYPESNTANTDSGEPIDFISTLESNNTPKQKQTSIFPKDKTFLNAGLKTYSVRDAMGFTKALYTKGNNTNSLFKDSDFEAGSYSAKPQLESGNRAINPIQIFNTYIIFEVDNQVYIADQHAAAEKINFEKLLKSIGEVRSKDLLIPEIIDLKHSEKAVILDQKQSLEDLGFNVEDFGGNSIQITSIPELSTTIEIREIIEDLLKDESELGVDFAEEVIGHFKTTKSVYLRVATIACHSSIRAGQPLNIDEMRNIIKDMFLIETSPTCPHGRPIYWTLTKNEIEKKFNRDI